MNEFDQKTLLTDVVKTDKGWTFEYRYNKYQAWNIFSNPQENIVRAQHAAMLRVMKKDYMASIQNTKTR